MTLNQLQMVFFDATAQTWHQHSNGGGWVENTASVETAAYVSEDSFVYNHATVSGAVNIMHGSRVYAYANIQSSGSVIIDHASEVYGLGTDLIGHDIYVDHTSLVNLGHLRSNVSINYNVQVSSGVLLDGSASLYPYAVNITDGVTIMGSVTVLSGLIQGKNNAAANAGPQITGNEYSTILIKGNTQITSKAAGHPNVYSHDNSSVTLDGNALLQNCAQILTTGTTVYTLTTTLNGGC